MRCEPPAPVEDVPRDRLGEPVGDCEPGLAGEDELLLESRTSFRSLLMLERFSLVAAAPSFLDDDASWLVRRFCC